MLAEPTLADPPAVVAPFGYGAWDRLWQQQRATRAPEAAAAVPDSLVDEVALVGPKERIQERCQAWKDSPVTSMVLGAGQPEALQAVAEVVL